MDGQFHYDESAKMWRRDVEPDMDTAYAAILSALAEVACDNPEFAGDADNPPTGYMLSATIHGMYTVFLTIGCECGSRLARDIGVQSPMKIKRVPVILHGPVEKHPEHDYYTVRAFKPVD